MPADTKGLDEALVECEKEISRLNQICEYRQEKNRLCPIYPKCVECNGVNDKCFIGIAKKKAEIRFKGLEEKLEVLRAEGFRVTTGG